MMTNLQSSGPCAMICLLAILLVALGSVSACSDKGSESKSVADANAGKSLSSPDAGDQGKSGAQPDQKPAKELEDPATKPAPATMQENVELLATRKEHDEGRVTVRHILIAFDGTGTKATRSQSEAEALAMETYARIAVGGEDFRKLAPEVSDDRNDLYGLYMEERVGIIGTEYERRHMASAFGDVAWKLEIGEIGVAPFDHGSSRFGWHIIKRIR